MRFLEQSEKIKQGILDEQKAKKKDLRYCSSIALEGRKDDLTSNDTKKPPKKKPKTTNNGNDGCN